MASSKKVKQSRTYLTGEKGVNRVRLFPDERTKLLELEYYDEGRRRKRIALGHDDYPKGKAAAEALAAALRMHEGPRSSELRLYELFDRYEREVTPTKKASTQDHDRRARRLFEECWGRNAKVKELDRSDWDSFIKLRRAGALRPLGGHRKVAGVRARAVEQDLRFVRAVCNWAITVRENGKRLVESNPFFGFRIPVEKNPRQPLVSEEEFTALEMAAETLGGSVPLYLRLVDGTGHRCNSVAQLRWSDISPDGCSIRIREEIDKQGIEHVIPLSERVSDTLRSERRRRATIGDGWLFPSPSDPDRCVSRHLVRDWWQKLEKGAGLDRVPGRGWHSLRRKFATDLDKSGARMADIAHLGGWKGTQTLQKCYIKADAGTMRDALEMRARLRAHTA